MMRWPHAWILGLALAIAAAGCRTCDKVETELRAREKELREVKDELYRTRAYNNGLQAELSTVTGGPPPSCGEPPVTAYPIRSLVMGRQTGGRDDSSGSGDQALQVVVQPMDAENQAVKIPGSLLITAAEITPEGAKRPLSQWEIPGEQLRHSWQDGLLTHGYVLVLPWKTCPTTEKLRVIAQFKVPDGRVFEADKDVTIHVPPSSPRPAFPVSSGPITVVPGPPELIPAPTPPPTAGELILPSPRRVEPSTSGPSISNKPATYLQPVQLERTGPDGQPIWRVVDKREK
jgi:hypothetical protein